MPENPNLTTEDALGNPPSLPTKPIIPGDAPPPPLPGAGSTAPFFSGSLPPQTQLDVDFSRGRVLSPRIPKNSLMPLGIQSNPSTNAGVNSTGRVLTKTPGFTNMDLVNNGQTRVALAAASSAGGSTGGSVAFNFRGVWLAVVPYFKGDEVIYQTSYWMATAASTNSAPATGNANWQVVGSYSAFRGPWSSSTAYVAGDEVTYNGNFWVATTANTNSAPSTSNSNWVIAGPDNLDAVQDGTVFGRTPTSNYGQQTPIGKITGLEVSSNADLEFGLTGYIIYDNNASGSITITQVTDNNSPNGNNTKMKIVEAKVGAGPTPGLGGFYYTLSQDNGVITGDTYHVGDTYIIDLVANIPVGYTLNFASNSLGTGGSYQWLNSSLAGSSTPPVGVGNWQHYLVKVIIGTSPSSANAFPFFYLTGADGVTWYVSSMEILDMDQIPRKSGGGRHIGPGPGGGVKWGHGIGVNGGARSVGVVMHGGNNRTFMTTDPFYGVYGNPSFPHQIFLNGGYIGHDVSSVNNPRLRVNSTGAGREYSFMSNQDGTARINDETGGAARTYLNSSPNWSFFGSPGGRSVENFGGPAPYGGSFTGIHSATGNIVGLGAINTDVSGLGYFWQSGGSAAGIQNIYDGTNNATRTYLNSTPQWGFFGSPTQSVENFGQVTQMSAGSPRLQYNDTNASGRKFDTDSGAVSAGIWSVADLTAGNTRTYLNSTPQWGFFGSPADNVHVFGTGKVHTTGTSASASPAYRTEDTNTGGRTFDFDNGGGPDVGRLHLYDATAGSLRTYLTSTPQWGFFGSPATPLETFLSAGSTRTFVNGGTPAVEFAMNNTDTGGREYSLSSQDGGNGLYLDETAGSIRTTMIANPGIGFFGTPNSEGNNFFDVYGTRPRCDGAAPGWEANDTNASGTAAYFLSGHSAAGYQNIYMSGEKTYLNTNSQWGFYGTPGQAVTINAGANPSEYIDINNGSTNTGIRNNYTGASGRQWGFLSGFPAAANWVLYDHSGGGSRYILDASGNGDFHGGTPNSGFLSAGAVNFADTSGNLKLKNISTAIYSGTGSAPTSVAQVPSLSVTITTKGNNVLIVATLNASIAASTALILSVYIYKDGSQMAGSAAIQIGGASFSALNAFSIPIMWIDSPTAASHTYAIYWQTNTANKWQNSGQSTLQVVELG